MQQTVDIRSVYQRPRTKPQQGEGIRLSRQGQGEGLGPRASIPGGTRTRERGGLCAVNNQVIRTGAANEVLQTNMCHQQVSDDTITPRCRYNMALYTLIYYSRILVNLWFNMIIYNLFLQTLNQSKHICLAHSNKLHQSIHKARRQTEINQSVNQGPEVLSAEGKEADCIPAIIPAGIRLSLSPYI